MPTNAGAVAVAVMNEAGSTLDDDCEVAKYQAAAACAQLATLVAAGRGGGPLLAAARKAYSTTGVLSTLLAMNLK